MKPKRSPASHSATRDALIEATERLMREEGYAAVSARRIGAKAGLHGQLIHYYFDNIDDLYLAVFRRITEAGLKHLDEALRSERPIHAIWMLAKDPERARLTTEFMALANHRPAIREEIARVAADARRQQIDGIARHLESRGTDARLPIAAIPLLLSGVSYILALEDALGLSVGHAETETVLENLLAGLESG